MKIQYKYQKFQAEAAKAVVDVFAGQPNQTSRFRVDQGVLSSQRLLRERQNTSGGNIDPDMVDPYISDHAGYIGWNNAPIVRRLTDEKILENLNRVQHLKKPSFPNTNNASNHLEVLNSERYPYVLAGYICKLIEEIQATQRKEPTQ